MYVRRTIIGVIDAANLLLHCPLMSRHATSRRSRHFASRLSVCYRSINDTRSEYIYGVARYRRTPRL